MTKMKSDKETKRILDDHERRISHLESLLSKPRVGTPAKDKRKLTDHILELRNKGFLSQPKTAEEVHKKLQETYHCELNRVAVALLRLSNRKQLRRASKVIDKKTYQAYVW